MGFFACLTGRQAALIMTIPLCHPEGLQPRRIPWFSAIISNHCCGWDSSPA